MGILSDIYNSVAKFFRQQDEAVCGDASKSVATNRLKLVLMQDRTNLTPKVLEQMRSELIDLLSKYLEMDKDMLELNFEQDGEQVALMLSIPVIRAKDEEEIEASQADTENNENTEAEENSSEDSDSECEENEISDENNEKEEENETSCQIENTESENEDSNESNNENSTCENSSSPTKKTKKKAKCENNAENVDANSIAE
ncbi:MAG: cell division topological specificity factor MinE [bacterium]|nr:cell division topological specificity factor MinE [bacterium]